MLLEDLHKLLSACLKVKSTVILIQSIKGKECKDKVLRNEEKHGQPYTPVVLVSTGHLDRPTDTSIGT